MTAPNRTVAGGRIDRTARLSFSYDGVEYRGCAGDTLASALLANGLRQVTTSVKLGRPRGILAAGLEEPNALVQIETPYPEPMLTATTVELYDGLVARGLPGQGRLADHPDPARHDAQHAHCDVLVIGGGPAGLVAALSAARSGARTIILDDQPELGGALLGTADGPVDWLDSVSAELAAAPDVRVLTRTTAFGYYDDGFVLAVERRTDHLPVGERAGKARQRVWRIRARRVVLAAGAYERPIVFTDNDRPGVMLASAARTYLNRYGVLAGREVVVFTTNDSAYRAATDLADAGATVTLVDPRHEITPFWHSECARRGIAIRTGSVVCGTSGTSAVTSAHVATLDGDGVLGERTGVACDLLLVSGGWNPTAQLYSQAGGRLAYDPGRGAFVPSTQLDTLWVAGAAAGEQQTRACLESGLVGARAALASLGIPAGEVELPSLPAAEAETPAVSCWRVPETGDHGADTQFVDLQRDATVTDILHAVGAGMTSVELVKRYTTIGTAHDQGKTSGVIASALVAEATGIDIGQLGTSSYRPPYTPVSFATLAGRDRGEIFDPVRVSALHRWHVEHGALFENVGQWKRPWYYPKPGEDLETAVLRECRAAREGVALMDGSTLGKINVQGRDAGEFLDRMYTNLMSTLKPGSVRYGVMCGLDGMVIDDGTVIRVSDEQFLLTTTTGNAAMILDWMEEFLQTEWPELSVRLTSVTEHWVTVPLVGPKSREVLAALAPDLDVSNEAFGFMTWKDTTVAGIATKVCRISFSGELAYEINVNAWYGPALWEALIEAGEPYAITPYGTETMHVLRAEKGYPIIGQDTDGTVTPQDLGMSWVVSKKKPDFIGKRSHQRPENQRADRRHLVGLLPIDPSARLHEGAQLIGTEQVPEPPVPMLGHVTSSYRSAALGRTFALALVSAGRERLGENLYAWQDGEVIPVTVTDSVLYDKEGARRDG